MGQPSSVVIIGAGVMGLGVAWQLSKAGVDVTVLEKDRPGAGASRAAAGMLAPMAELQYDEAPLMHFSLASQQRWPSFVQELERAAQMSVEYETSGTLLVAWDRDEADDLKRHFEYQQQMGLNVEWLSGRGLRRKEKMLSPRIVGGVHCEDDVQVSNRRYVEALEIAARSAGATIHSACEAESLIYDGTQVRGVRCKDGRSVHADMTVVAAGAWSHALRIPDLVPLHIRPVKGQMMALQMDPKYPLIQHVIRRRLEGVYLVPKQDGTLVVGGTSEEMGFDDRLTAYGLRHLLEHAFEIVPGIDELEIKETWVGFRPAGRDSGPLLGRSSIAGLAMITGHFRHGIQLSPLSIDVVTNAILHGALPEIAQAFDPARFEPNA